MILGVDPGVAGALAWFEAGRIVHVEDLPTVIVERGGSRRQRLNCALLAELLRRLPADEACVEEVAPRPARRDKHGNTVAHGDTPMTAGYLMQAFGNVEGVLATLGIPTTFVDPKQWRRAMGASAPAGADYRTRKEASRLRALELYPSAAEFFRLRTRPDRAEAALIAGWRAQTRAAA